MISSVYCRTKLRGRGSTTKHPQLYPVASKTATSPQHGKPLSLSLMMTIVNIFSRTCVCLFAPTRQTRTKKILFRVGQHAHPPAPSQATPGGAPATSDISRAGSLPKHQHQQQPKNKDDNNQPAVAAARGTHSRARQRRPHPHKSCSSPPPRCNHQPTGRGRSVTHYASLVATAGASPLLDAKRAATARNGNVTAPFAAATDRRKRYPAMRSFVLERGFPSPPSARDLKLRIA